MKRVIPLVLAWLCVGTPDASAGLFPYTPPTRPPGPAHLGFTGDPRQCMNHLPPFVAAFFGSALCVETLAAQQFVMVWDLPARTDVAGYRVFRNADLATPIAFVDDREFTTVTIAGAAAGDCFRVASVFTSGEESLPSNMTCVPSGWQPLQELRTPIAGLQYWTGEAHNMPGSYVLARPALGDSIKLGNRNYHLDLGLATAYRWEYTRGHWSWPQLTADVAGAVIYDASASLISIEWGCGAYELAIADEPPGTHAMQWGTSLGVMPYTGAMSGRPYSWTVDVTDVVRGWSEGWLPANGLIARTLREGGSADNFYCADLPFLSLHLRYFPYP